MLTSHPCPSIDGDGLMYPAFYNSRHIIACPATSRTTTHAGTGRYVGGQNEISVAATSLATGRPWALPPHLMNGKEMFARDFA